MTLEVVKFIQGYFIHYDKEMITRVGEEEIRVGVNSSNLNEELGQVDYIFSDKTGTLTCNHMEFKNLCVGGKSYGEGSHGYVELAPDDLEELPQVTNVNFSDQQLFTDL